MRQTQEECDSVAKDFVKDLSNKLPGEPAAILCPQVEAAEVAKAAEVYNEHVDTWIKDMAKPIGAMRRRKW